MKKENGAISLGTGICIFIIILLLMIIVGMYYYNKQVEDKKISNIVNSKDEKIGEEIPNTEEIDVINQVNNYGEPISPESITYLKDGYLYFAENGDTKAQQIEGVSNIKSLKVYNIGAGINRVPFVVTENGKVYRLNSKKELVEYKELSEYEVDEIIDHTGEEYDVFTLLLKDGTIKKVEIKEVEK